jgi:transcriptional regulator with XRE-family HTH domain
MQGIDPKSFGRRIRERREELVWSQSRLAEESGYSQSNIGWIEQGKSKDPRKQAISLAEALRSTPAWLLHGTGPRETGPKILTTEQLQAIYDAMSVEAKAAVTATVEKYQARKKRA